MSKTAVVIVHYRNENDTWKCLNSMAKNNNNLSTEIILVVNPFKNSEQDFIKKIKKDFTSIRIIENKENVGFTRANNLGIKEALNIDCNYIILLNNDTVVSSDLINKLAIFASNSEGIGLVSPKIYFAKGFEYHRDRYQESDKGKVLWYAGGLLDWHNIYGTHRGVDEVDHGQYDKVSGTDFATGCCMLINSVVVEKIGFLDENYFMYYEDIDYSVRVKKAGMKVVYCPEVFLWHKNASSSGRPGSPLHIYYQTRNRLYFGFKYASLNTKKALLLDSLRLLLKRPDSRGAVKDFYLGRMGGGNI